tara:strand:- start:548 stop:889 length:342 start_codon:yes stop_codon:yes gene_type:complete
MSEQELEKRMEEIRQIGNDYASAKADLNYLEHYRKIRLAQMMKEKMSTCANMSVAKADLESRAEEEYIKLCQDLKNAVEQESRLAWSKKMVELKFEFWKTNQISAMSERKKYG